MPASLIQEEKEPVLLSVGATMDDMYDALLENASNQKSCIINKRKLVEWGNKLGH